MKYSITEILILAVGVIVLIPLAVALLTPSTDAFTMGFLWLAAVAVFLIGFFFVRGRGRRE